MIVQFIVDCDQKDVQNNAAIWANKNADSNN